MMSKTRYLQLKQQRKELHAEMKRFKKFFRNSLKIPLKERQQIHDSIIANFKSAKREYKLVTELLDIQKELLQTVRRTNWLGMLHAPI